MPTLSDTQIRNAKPGERPLRLYDDRGLYLEVSPRGGKWWRLKYSFEGKARLLSLGTYPDTGLKAVRDKRDVWSRKAWTRAQPAKPRRRADPRSCSTASKRLRANGMRRFTLLR